MTVVMYTDGSCQGNPGPGGWGVFTPGQDGTEERELFGGESWTTNQRMELTAAIEALSSLSEPGQQVILYTDSMYVLNGITKWINGWKRNGWKTAARTAVKNAELWQALDAVAAKHTIEWRWVKGHSGDVGNERADQLANKGTAMYG